MTNKEIFFISGAWNTGIGFIIHGYDFIITTVQTVGFAKYVVIRNSEHKPQLAKVIFVDYSIGLAFIERKIQQEASLDVLSFELALLAQPVTIYKINYYNKLSTTVEELLDSNIIINNIKYLQIKDDSSINTGEIVLNRRLEFVGITIFKEGKNLVLPAKYILKVMEEYVDIKTEALRCPNCLKIISKEQIINSICPVCSSQIIPELLQDMLPSMTKTDKHIEAVIKKLGFDLNLSRLGQHFWEIQQGSAVIFIRYEPEMKFIVAFSSICELRKEKNLDIDKLLLEENSKLKMLSFSIDKNRIFLSTPYIVEDSFDEKFALDIFKKLFDKSDYYDDIIIKMLA